MSGIAISDSDLRWLLAHGAVLYFDDGRKLGIEFRRTRDNLAIQASAWTFGQLMTEARRLDE